jgi:ABC-type transport system involved in multi-copper enzyme maturation permease subunit
MKYELLWNIRKKKFIGMVVVAFVLVTLSLALPVELSGIVGQTVSQDPDYVVRSGAGIGGLGFFLFAMVTVMNSISGEFESGTIIPLLTKPVSRTIVFLAKLSAAVVTLLPVYGVLYLYLTIGATVIYGPQSNLHLVPLSLLGSFMSTLVWMAIVLAVGSVSKSSLLAALVPFGAFIALSISAPIISLFSGQAWILTYLPGGGVTGYIKGVGASSPFSPGVSVSTGTDSIAATIITYVLHPASEVTFFKIGGLQGGTAASLVELYSEPLSFVVLRSIAVALAYVLAFLFISWYSIRRAQVME